MWCLAPLLLLVAAGAAEPQYGYLPPPANPCEPVQSVVYTTLVKDTVAVSTQRQVNTQYTTVTSYQQQIVPTTRYQTRYQTQVQYQTSQVQSQVQVSREQIVTSSQQAPAVFQTQYATSIRIVPQVSYVVSTRVQTQVVPVELTNTRYQTQYRDQVQYQTSRVVRTSVVQVTGRDVFSTAYDTQYRTSVVQRPGQTQTRYATTTLVQQSVQVQTVPSPPVVSTRVANSQRVIPTTVVSTRYQDQVVTRTQYVTMTQYQTQTQVQTQYVTQEVVVTSEVPREVIQTQYTTQVVPQTSVQTVYSTVYNNPRPVIRTQVSYYQSVVSVPGPDRVVSSQVVDTQQRQEVVYSTENVQRPVTQTRTVTATCEQQGYNYQEPRNPLNF